MATFTEIVASIRNDANLTSTESETRVGVRVNEYYKRVTSSIGLNLTRRTTVQASATLGVSTLTFTALEKITNVVDRSSTPHVVLHEISMEEMRSRGGSTLATPRCYAISAYGASTVTIVMDCIPETAFTLYADGYAQASTLSGSQIPAFSEDFHDVLKLGPLADEYRKMNKPQLYRETKVEYEARLSDLKFFANKSAYADNYQGKTKDRFVGVGSVGSGGGSSSINGATSWEQTGLITFNRQPSLPPFAITAPSDKVDNLNADLLDDLDWDDFDVKNVLAYGAVGDGVTDDRAAIQAAIDAVPITGGKVYLPKGTFAVASTLIIKSYLVFEGAGRGLTTLKWTGGTSGFMLRASTTAVSHKAHIKGITFDADNSSLMSTIYLVSPQQYRIQNIGIVNVPDNGYGLRIEATASTGEDSPLFWHRNAVANHIEDVTMQSVGTAIQLTGNGLSGGVGHYCTDNFFYNIKLVQVALTGIRFVQTADNNFFYGTFISLDANSARGIVLNDSATPAAEVEVYGNEFHGLAIDSFGISGASGILFNAQKQLLVSGFFHSPETFGGTLINDTAGRSISHYIVNNQRDGSFNNMEIIKKGVEVTGETATSTTTGTTSNVDFSGADVYRCNNATLRTITGFLAPASGSRRLTVISVGAGQVTLSDQVTSTAANQIITGSGVSINLAPGSGRAVLEYDVTTARWRVVHHEQGAWIAYTPVWSSATPPTVGNATLVGAYKLSGRTVQFRMRFVFGNTSTVGVGVFTFTIPLTAAAVTNPATFVGKILDTGTTHYPAIGHLDSTTTFNVYHTTATNTGDGAAVPITWATGDEISMSGTYEIA